MSELLCPGEVAARLKVTRRQVLNYIAEGRLKGVKISPRVVRIAEDSLNAFLAANEYHGTPTDEHFTVTAALNRAGIPSPSKGLLDDTARWLRVRGVREVKRRGANGFVLDDKDLAELKEVVHADA